jgi:hypothetical protein
MKNLDSETKRKIKIVNSLNDDFINQEDWFDKLSKMLCISPNILPRFIMQYTPEFYNKACSKLMDNSETVTEDNTTINNKKNVPIQKVKNEYRKHTILNSGINFEERGWCSELAQKLNITPAAVLLWIKTNMPELYENSYPRIKKEKVVVKKPKEKRVYYRRKSKDPVSINYKNFDENITDEQRIEIIKNLPNDFLQQKGWRIKLIEKINVPSKDLFSWIKTNVPEFYTKAYENSKDVEINKEVEVADRYKELKAARLKIINESNIDFSKNTWCVELSKLFGISPESTKIWMESNLLDLMGTFAKPISQSTVDKINNIKNSNIDFSKRNWYIELAKEINSTPKATFSFVANYMPEFFENCYHDNQSATIADYIRIVNESDIDLNKFGWEKDLVNLIGIKEKNAKQWIKNHMFDLNNKSIVAFKDSLIDNNEASNKEVSNKEIPNNEKSNTVNNIDDKTEVVNTPVNNSKNNPANNSNNISNNENIEVKKNATEIFLNSLGIDFTKKDWCIRLSIELNNSPDRAFDFVKYKAPNLFKICYLDEDSNNALNKSVKKISSDRMNQMIKIINNGTVDFSKRGWSTELGRIFNIEPISAYIWVKNNMSSFYEKNCKKNKVKSED